MLHTAMSFRNSKIAFAIVTAALACSSKPEVVFNSAWWQTGAAP